jgi:hypothetical protein
MLPPSHNATITSNTGANRGVAVATNDVMNDFSSGDSGFAGAASRIQNNDGEVGNSGAVSGGSAGGFLDSSPTRGGTSGGVSVCPDNIWGLPVVTSSASAGEKSQSRRVMPATQLAHVHDAVVFFPNKVAYHISCFYHAQDMNHH